MDAVPISKKIIAFGSKQIFLYVPPAIRTTPKLTPIYSPKFTIALTRTPSLSPYHARFLVPLNFSKYDLRDYLFHAYRIKCHNIRSYVKQMPVRETEDKPRHFFREESKKYMTVEMETPFVWPAEPEDWTPWGKEDYENQVKEMTRASGAMTEEDKRNEQEALRLQAKQMLGWKGKEKPVEKADAEKTKSKKTGATARPSLRKQWEQKRSPRMLGMR